MKKIPSFFSGKAAPLEEAAAFDPPPSPLKAAFQRSRQERNIELVWPVLKAATLYAVVANDPAGEHWFLTRSPDPERLCVTVAEQLDALNSVQWPKQRVLGGDLVAMLPPVHEIVVVYPDGGDYLTREHLAWYRQLA